ncbi:hypothetical protein DAEQUDRAFT_723522 [Daedalea quercina L-15889]|uniref:F-box domain-containing protein n=1 Tax=Daedalea quercina L-15889 TaxID=1314783 RepID=A0A165SFJ1_9APHY|nr:hypothetical protein DAEQUDRAFT_723522 [Daedalea quercina L-15889]
MATVLAVTCKTVYAWVIPVLYSTVVLTTESQIITFEDTLRASSKIVHHSGHPTEHPLDSYIRCLWVGPNRCRLGRTWRNLKDMESSDSDGATGGASGAQAPGPDVWAYFEDTLTSCATLRALSIVDYPDVILPSIIRHCPTSLESISIYPSYTLHLDLPDISHLTSLHDITFS